MKTVYTLAFDLYAIDSWDGDGAGNGPDRFEVIVNRATIFSETIANTHTYQSWDRQPDEGRQHIGFHAGFVDSIYRNVELEFEVEQGDFVYIHWRALGLQAMNDESWGIDNVRVSWEYRPVPAPGAAGVLVGSLGLWGGRRRRAARSA